MGEIAIGSTVSRHRRDHGTSRHASAVRRPQVKETKALSPVVLPLRATQQQIIRMANDLALANDPRETSSVIKQRLGIEERVIDRVLDLDRIRHTNGFQTLRHYIHGGLVAARGHMHALDALHSLRRHVIDGVIAAGSNMRSIFREIA